MSKAALLFVFLSVVLKLGIANAPECLNYWVVWHVGQGQWVTHVVNDQCVHYDIGGELGSFKFIQNKFMKTCGQKKNYVSLSHWDFDHYINLIPVSKLVRNICWIHKPGPTKMNKSIRAIEDLNIPACTNDFPVSLQQWSPTEARTSNDTSTVSLDQGFLMPGDSPIGKEKIWSVEMKRLQTVRVLILGHHGSRTSTGKFLLDHLPNLKIAVSSARMKKYGHPHKETLQRLAKNKTPVLKTEDWGSIYFY
jgi:competence protein ComEC